MEAEVLSTITGHQPPPPPTYARRTVFVFVDGFDLATLAGLRYARSLRPTTLRAVHFVIDGIQADLLRQQWMQADRGIPLEFIDAPDRRLVRAAADLVSEEVEIPGTHVTVVLPRRSYSPLLGRFLHDRTADKIARVVSRIPRSAATIIPYDVQSRLEMMQEREAARAAGKPVSEPAGPVAEGKPAGKRASAKKGGAGSYERPVPAAGADPIGSLTSPGRATVVGRVRSVEIRPVRGSCVFACTVADSTGQLTALFYGREHIPGVEPGAKIRLTGAFGIRDGAPGMINPTYELLSQSP
jgi:hypothetical protein